MSDYRRPKQSAHVLKLSSATTVVHKMIRATKAVSAPSRSASMDTLLALGKAAANINVNNPLLGTWMPAADKACANSHTPAGCATNFNNAHTATRPEGSGASGKTPI